ncbi:hypothetical protein M758_1G276700 [Ceratodon purpureus]|uniref:Uncharacterized protein n=1 Tax=Ceratodon purpureus TaxID=3225 RepID=A0A8T0JAT6_CERPU|nr:hypothetical protein KC19_1G285200 [Ceratodon purpureus]KAG0631753.1 hypothetical protein M758_1G276700 [Ceratodon purpureus]
MSQIEDYFDAISFQAGRPTCQTLDEWDDGQIFHGEGGQIGEKEWRVEKRNLSTGERGVDRRDADGCNRLLIDVLPEHKVHTSAYGASGFAAVFYRATTVFYRATAVF